MFSFTNKRDSMVAALLLFYFMYPYFIWNGFWGSIEVKSLLSLVFGLIFYKNFDKNNLSLMLLFFVTIVFYVVINKFNLIFSLTFFTLVFLPFAKCEFQKDVYLNFFNIYSLVMTISLIVWIMVLLGVMPPLGTIPPLNSLKTSVYQVYPLLVRTNDSIRFFGPFDEPGVIGTISGLLMCIEKYNFNDKRNIIVFISGLCSLSFFFYMLTVIYCLVYYVFEKRRFKSAIVYIVLLIFAMITIENIPVLNEVLGERFVWDSESGSFAGDNRTNEYGKYYFERIIGTNEFWWGVDDKKSFLEKVAGSCSFVNTIIVNGFVFVLMYLLLFFLYGWKYKYNLVSYLLFVLVFVSTIYQRPFLFRAEYIFLWSSLVMNIRNKMVLL